MRVVVVVVAPAVSPRSFSQLVPRGVCTATRREKAAGRRTRTLLATSAAAAAAAAVCYRTTEA